MEKSLRRLIAPPALAMLTVALLTLATHAFGLVFGDPGQGLSQIRTQIEQAMRDQYGPSFELESGLVELLYWTFEAGALASCLLVVVGSGLMLAQRSWWLALSAAILMLTPFLWLCCCPLTAGIGIWALVILARPDVRAAMRGRVDSAPPPAFTVPPPPPPEKPPHGGGWGSGA